MKRKSIEITFIFGLITLVQLISQIVLVRIFGASLEYDSFLAAVALPSVLVTVIYGTLSDTFMPLYASQADKDKNKFVSAIISSLLPFLLISSTILFVSVSIFGILFGFGGTLLFTNSLPLFQFMIWTLPFAGMATVFGSLHYFHKKFTRFPLAQLLGAISSLAITLALYKYIGAWSLAIGFLVNILAQFILILPSEKIKIALPNPNIFLPLLLSWLPLIISSFAVRSDTLLMRAFGSSLGEGQLVYLNLVTKMYSLGSGIVTIGIQVLLLPTLLDRFVHHQYTEAKKLVLKTKIVGILLSVGTSLAIMVLGPITIKYLFVGGKFTESDFASVSELFPVFLIPSFAWGLNAIFFQPLIALRKTWSLGVVNVLSLAVAWLTTQILFTQDSGVSAIAIGLSILLFGGIIGSELLWQIYQRKLSH